MAGVYIVYASEDEQFVRRLYDALQSSGCEPTSDAAVLSGASWRQEIEKAILGSEKLIYVISPDSLASEVCISELEYALEVSKQIIPILRRSPTQRQMVPSAIAERNWISFDEDSQFDRSLDLLTTALVADRDWDQIHTRLLVRATEWDDSAHDSSFLLRGSELQAAEQWISEHTGHEGAPPTDLQREYIYASRRAQGRRQRQVTAFVFATLILALLTVSFGAIFARQEALQVRVLEEKLKAHPTVTVTVARQPRPGVTVTQRITASPQPAVTVTERVAASPRPNSTVTQFVAVASSGSGSDWTTGFAAIGTGIAGLGTAAAGYAAIVAARRKRDSVNARRTYHHPVPRRKESSHRSELACRGRSDTEGTRYQGARDEPCRPRRVGIGYARRLLPAARC